MSWGEGLPVPALSIFSISFSIMVPFYNSTQTHTHTHKVNSIILYKNNVIVIVLNTKKCFSTNGCLLFILTMAKDCGDNGPSDWLVGACAGAAGGGVPLEILRLAIRSSNSVVV